MTESFGIDGVDLGEVAEVNQKHRGAQGSASARYGDYVRQEEHRWTQIHGPGGDIRINFAVTRAAIATTKESLPAALVPVVCQCITMCFH